jgi:hypothetical protein
MGALDPAVNNDLLGLDAPVDAGLRRDEKFGALEVALYLAVDLDGTLRDDAADDFQSVIDD